MTQQSQAVPAKTLSFQPHVDFDAGLISRLGKSGPQIGRAHV